MTANYSLLIESKTKVFVMFQIIQIPFSYATLEIPKSTKLMIHRLQCFATAFVKLFKNWATTLST